MKIVTVLPCAKQSQYWVDFYIVGKHNSGPDDSFQIDVLLLLRTKCCWHESSELGNSGRFNEHKAAFSKEQISYRKNSQFRRLESLHRSCNSLLR